MFSPTLMSILSLAAMAFLGCAAQAVEPQQAMVVVRDAETGELRAPTPAEARALHPRPSVSAAASATPAPQMVTGPGGRRSVQLGERQMVYSVMTRAADGKLAEQCVHGVHAAERAIGSPPRPGSAQPAATKPGEHRHDSR